MRSLAADTLGADLLVTDNESSVAIEVELTTKAPRRLQHLIRSWCRSPHIERVLYVVPSGSTERAVKRAIERVIAEDRVEVLRLSELS